MGLPNTESPAERQEEKTQQDPTTGQPTTRNAPESDEHQESTTKVNENGELETDSETLEETAPVEEELV